MSDLTRATTALFVPGNRPERFAKAAASGADVVIVDLEDAVAPQAKADARASLVRALRSGELAAVVRVNASSSDYFAQDLAALSALSGTSNLLGIMPAKVESAADLAPFIGHADLSAIALVPLIESALGLRDIDAIAAVSGVVRLAFGAIDFAADIAAGDDDRFLDYARSRLVLASRAASLAAPLDSPCTAIDEVELVTTSARLARGFGFGGKLCIHPAQLAAVRAAFRPSSAEIAWAEKITSAGPGAVKINGHMVDPPVVARAERILQLIEESRS